MEKFNNLPENAEENIIKAMIKVAIGNDADNIKDFISLIGLDEDQKAMLWRAILSQLSSQRKEIDDEIPHPLPVRQTDCLSGVEKSLISYIQELCDLKDINIQDEELLKSEIYNELKNEIGIQAGDDTYWNEQIKEIITLLKEYSEISDLTGIVKNENLESIFTIGDLRNANAAEDFNGEPWVKPEKNVNDKTYSQIRNKDKILDILNNPNKLDNTYNKNQEDADKKMSFISLLMPQYGRRVEIEDLNRNFWVIADIVDGMSNWIFEESPLNRVIEKLISETVQLWENILYLWIEIALISQKKSDENLTLIDSMKIIESEDLLRYESIPVATCKLNRDETYDIKIAKFKFMDEEVDLNQTQEYNPLIEYEDTYAEQDLCYISKIKLNNYRKNYYSGEWFKEITFSLLNNVQNQNIEKRKRQTYQIFEKYYKDGEEKNRELVISVDPACEVTDKIENNSDKRFTPYIFCANYHNGKFFVGYPFSATENYLVENNRETLYCGIKIYPRIEIERLKDGSKKIKKFELEIYDAIESIYSSPSTQKLIGIFTADADKGDIKNNKIFMTYKSIKEINAINNDNYFNKYTLKEIEWKNIDFSYYLGECVSWREKTSRITKIEDLMKEPILLKIGNFLPEGQWNSELYSAPPVPSIGMMKLSGGYASQMRGDFTFYGIPTFYNTPPKINSTTQSSDNEEIIYTPPIKDAPTPTNYVNNSYGQNDGTPGMLYFYNFNWENYIPQNDIPGNILGDNTYSINSSLYDLCFLIDSTHMYGKHPGFEITEDYLLELGKSAVINYLTKVINISDHPHKDYYRNPCTFITFIGLVPSLKNNDFIQFDVNAACHVIKYMPAPDILKEEDGFLKNYTNQYNSFIEKEINYLGKPLGKIIASTFINRYDSYYDEGDFSYMFSSNNLYSKDENNNKERGLFIYNNSDTDNYCKLITINDLRKEYKVNFNSTFDGEIVYYDFYKAFQDQILSSLLVNNSNDFYQVSNGTIELSSKDGYKQIKDGNIRSVNGKSYLSRKYDSSIPHETDQRNTGLLLMQDEAENKKIIPFSSGKLIEEGNYTPRIFGGWKNDMLLDTKYSFKDVAINPPLVNGASINSNKTDEVEIIDESALPDWFYLTYFKADEDKYNHVITGIRDSKHGHDDISPLENFTVMKFQKENSDLKAYADLYYSVKNGTNKYLTEKSIVYDSNTYTFLETEESSDVITVKLKNSSGNLINLPGLFGKYFYITKNSRTVEINTINSKIVSYNLNDNNQFILTIKDDKSNNDLIFMNTVKDISIDEIDINDIPKYCFVVTRKEVSQYSIGYNNIIHYNYRYYDSYVYDKDDNARYTEKALKTLYKYGTEKIEADNILAVIFTNKEPPDKYQLEGHYGGIDYEYYYTNLPDAIEGIQQAGAQTLNVGPRIAYNSQNGTVFFDDHDIPSCFYIKTNLNNEITWSYSGVNKKGYVYYKFKFGDVRSCYNTLYWHLKNGKDFNEIFEVTEKIYDSNTGQYYDVTFDTDSKNPEVFIEYEVNEPDACIIPVNNIITIIDENGNSIKYKTNKVPTTAIITNS